MARNEQTFKAVAKLEAGQFKREARNIGKVVNSMKNTFLGFAASLGAGLGFGQLVSEMRKTAVELSTARATLENVSKEAHNVTVGNYETIISINKFGDAFKFVNGLANKYKQDLIALTNGYAQFKAASDQAGVSMEDQEKIFRALTKAATFYHMSADRTRDMMNAVIQMMSKGKVASEELRRQLGNSLPGAFGIMAVAAQKAGIATTGTVAELEDLMRKSQVLSAQVLPYFADELNAITKDINLDSIQLSLNELKNAWIKLTQELNFEGFYNNIIKSTTNALNYVSTHVRQVTSTIVGLFTALGSMKLYSGLQKQGEMWVSDQKRNYAKVSREYKKMRAELGRYEKKYQEAVQFKRNEKENRVEMFKNPAAKTPIPTHELEEMNSKLDATNAKLAQMNKLEETSKKNYNGIQMAALGLKNVVKSIGATIMSMGIVAIASAIVGYIAKMITNAIEFKKELREIQKIGEDFGDGSKAATKALEVQKKQVDDLLVILKDVNTSEKEREVALNRIKGIMGEVNSNGITTKSTYDEIVTKVNEWYDALWKVKRLEAILTESQNQSVKLQDLELQKAQLEADIRSHQRAMGRDDYGNTVWVDKAFEGNKERRRQLKLIDAEIERRKNLKKSLDDEASALQKEIVIQEAENEVKNDYNKDNTDNGGKKEKTPQERLNDALDDHDKRMRELQNQYNRGAIKLEEYDKAVMKLYQDTWKEIAAFDELETLLDGVANGHERANEIAQGADFASVWEEVESIIEEANNEIEEYLENLDKATEDWMGYERPKPATRDTTFDYKKEQSEIYRESIDLLNDYKKKLEDAIKMATTAAAAGVTGAKEELNSLLQTLNKIIKETEDLKEKADLAEIYADFKKASSDAFTESIDGIRSMAQTYDRLSNAIIKYKEARGEKMTKGEKEEWEKLTTSVSLFMEILEAVTGIYKTINTLNQVWIALEGVKSAKQKENIGLAGAETAAEMTKTSAKAAGAVAGATEAGSSIPFPYNLIAIAAGIAAVLGALALMSKFENGGFVGGDRKHGDHNLVRANAGELILNPAQQRNILALANGKAGIGGGEVQFKIRGSDLIGAINNEQSRRKG